MISSYPPSLPTPPLITNRPLCRCFTVWRCVGSSCHRPPCSSLDPMISDETFVVLLCRNLPSPFICEWNNDMISVRMDSVTDDLRARRDSYVVRTLHEKQPSVDMILPPALLGYSSGSMANVGMSPRSGGWCAFGPLMIGLIVDKQWPCAIDNQ